MTDIEKYEEIVRIMDSVIMNPPPDCRPIKSTSKNKVYMTLYEIQKVIGKRKFVGEKVTESEAAERIIIIPPNATNGEVLEKVFPNLVYHYESHVEKWIAVDTDLVSNEEWLNTPYKIDREAADL